MSEFDPHSLEANAGTMGAQLIQIDTGKHVIANTICAAVCGACVIIAGGAAWLAIDARTEARLVEYYLMDPHSRTPEELASWAKFRKEHER